MELCNMYKEFKDTPNKVYFIEKNFMSQFEHKAQKRLCYNDSYAN